MTKQNRHNVITDSDSYKIVHNQAYTDETEAVYSYFEARRGSLYNETVFYGLTPLLEKIA